MRLTWRTEWPHGLLLAAMVAGSFAVAGRVHGPIPVHWGVNGTPDSWAGPFEGLFLLPLLGIVLYLVLVFAPRLDPLHADFAAFAGPYATLRLAVLGMLAGVHAMILAIALGVALNVMLVVPVLIGLLMLVIGTVLPRLEPNWIAGIRTPWTLSSRRSWDASHHVGGRVFVAGGALMLVAGAIGRAWALVAAVALLMVGVIAIVVYSYIVWRDDPDKQPRLGARRP
ncbi:MAG TPA: SdpI family protein [Candidatus Eisenbacteria bacterium]